MTLNHTDLSTESPSNERRRVDAYWLALDFHALAMAALPISKRRNARRSQIERASVKAFNAIGLAANGDEQEAKDSISTAFNAADSVLILTQGLVAEGRVTMEVYAAVSDFGNRLLERLRQLAKLPLSEWPLSALPPQAGVGQPSSEVTDATPEPEERTSVSERLRATQARAARLMARREVGVARRDHELHDEEDGRREEHGANGAPPSE